MNGQSLNKSSVATLLWELSGKDKNNARLLQQAAMGIQVRQFMLRSVVANAKRLGYQGNSIDGALDFFDSLPAPTTNSEKLPVTE